VSKASGENPDITFNVWDNTGPDGKPGTVLGSALVPITQIFDDVTAQQATEVIFDPPVLINGPFYLGLVLPTTVGDTLALFATDANEVDENTAFEQWDDGSWNDFVYSWGLPLTQSIYAQYCDVGFGIEDNHPVGGVKIYPNPVSGILNIDLDPSLVKGMTEIRIHNILGQLQMDFRIYPTDENITIPLHVLNQGIYIITISNKDMKISQRLIKL
jgi:hypothetical protein